MNFLEMFGFKKKNVVEGNNPATPTTQAPPVAETTPIQPVTETPQAETAQPAVAATTPTQQAA